MSTDAVHLARNCSAACAEMLGGHCLGDGCPYANTDSAPLALEPWIEDWSEYDPEVIEAKAEGRGFRRGVRLAHAQFAQGRKVGFAYGVLSVLCVLVLMEIIQWAAR